MMRALAALFAKDLLVEWRARAPLFALGCFVLTILLLFSFAVGADTAALRAHAGAYVWLSLLLTSTLLLGRSFQIETESGALEALVLTPVPAPALFFGKALANTLLLVALAGVALPAAFVLFDMGLREGPGPLALTVLLGAAGLAAPGTLYAGLTARLGARQVLLPLLLFPLIVPCLLASVKATSLAFSGDPMGQIGSWLQLLAAFDVLYWSICAVLFGKVIESA
jgi:heme exporter protein B